MTEVVRYELDDATRVAFEIAAGDGFRPAGATEVLGRVREAVDPAVRAAQVVLEQMKQVSPDEIEVKFGIKVSGRANWMIAKASTDANFEVKLIWRPGGTPMVQDAEEVADSDEPQQSTEG